MRAGGELADFGEVPRGAVAASLAACDIEEVQLTPAVEEAFDLDQLRAFLTRPNAVDGQFRESEQTATPVELSFQLGEFSYYVARAESEECADEIRASANVGVRVGTGFLDFEIDGVLWKRENRASAQFYASDSLAAATGSYEPDLDTSRLHDGMIEISMYVSPGHLRGDIDLAVYYFDDEQQLRQRLQGDFSSYSERQPLMQLKFPSDSCEDHELPFAYDQRIELLRAQSAGELREQVATRIAEGEQVDAVWKDDRETQVAIELGEPIEGTVCLDHGMPFSQMNLNSDWVVRIPIAGRLRSSDFRLNLPLHELFVGVDTAAISGATLHAWVPAATLSEAQAQALGSPVDVLNAWINYDFQPRPPQVDGIVYLHRELQSGSYTPVDCVAFPPGGDRDSGECRSGR